MADTPLTPEERMERATGNAPPETYAEVVPIEKAANGLLRHQLLTFGQVLDLPPPEPLVEGWIDKVLAPPWAFTFKKLFGNYGYPIGNLKGKKAIVFCTYGSPQFAIRTFFLNMPTKRLRRGVFNICGITDVVYKRFFAVPFVSEKKRKKYLEDVRNTASKL